MHWAVGLAAWWADAKAGLMVEKTAATLVGPPAVYWAARTVGALEVPMAVLLVARSDLSAQRSAGKWAAKRAVKMVALLAGPMVHRTADSKAER